MKTFDSVCIILTMLISKTQTQFSFKDVCCTVIPIIATISFPIIATNFMSMMTACNCRQAVIHQKVVALLFLESANEKNQAHAVA